MTLHTAIETSKIESAFLGEGTNKIFENKSTVVLEGSSKDVIGFSRWVKNQRLIVLQKESNSGNYRQIGTAKHGAIAAEIESLVNATREGLNRRTFVISDKATYEAPVYSGFVTKMPAQV